MWLLGVWSNTYCSLFGAFLLPSYELLELYNYIVTQLLWILTHMYWQESYLRESKDTYTVSSFDDVLEKHRSHESEILIVSLSGNECQEGSSSLTI